MKSLLLFCLLAIASVGYSQDWSPINISDPITHFLAEDSIKVNAGSGITRYIKPIQSVVIDSVITKNNHTVAITKKGYSGSSLGRGYFNSFPTKIKGQILGDTIENWLDSVVIKSIDNNGLDLIFLKKYVSNQSWVIGENLGLRLVAIVNTLDTMSLGGSMLDSVAKISIIATNSSNVILPNNPFHTSQIILSKNHGIIVLPDFTNVNQLMGRKMFTRYFLNLDTVINKNSLQLSTGDNYITAYSRSYGFYNSTKTEQYVNYTIIGDSLVGQSRVITAARVKYSTYAYTGSPPGVFTESTSRDSILKRLTVIYPSFSCILESAQIVPNAGISLTNFYGVTHGFGKNQLVRLIIDTAKTYVNNSLHVLGSSIPIYNNQIELLGIHNEFRNLDATKHRETDLATEQVVFFKNSTFEYGQKPTFNCEIADTLVKLQNKTLRAVDGNFTYTWLVCNSNIVIKDSVSSNFTPEYAGFYSVVVNDGFCFDTSRCVYVQGITCSLGDTLLQMNDSSLFATVDSADSYQWFECNSVISLLVGEEFKSFKPTIRGYYGVIVTKGTCIDTSRCVYSLLDSCTFSDTLLRFDNNVLVAAIDSADSYRWFDCENPLDRLTGEVGQIFKPKRRGNYRVIVTQGNCSYTSRCVYAFPNRCSFGDTLIKLNDTALVATVDSADWYQWYECGSRFNALTGEISKIFKPNYDGTFAVVISKLNCQDTSECILSVVNVKEHLSDENILVIFPNPANDFIVLNTGNRILSVDVFDRLGKKVLSATNQKRLDISTLEKGVYFIRVFTPSGFINKKFMKMGD